ncbi:MAG: FliH/SctL family protein, partial [Myxococcales bacterium]|nr:FliH/SctL family protein [Myxococcales bacterium]
APSGDSSPPNLSGLAAVAMPNLSGEDGGDASMEEADPTEESPAMPPPGSRSVLPTAGHAEPSEETLLERRAFAEAAAELAVARAQTLWDVEGQILDLAVSIAEVLIERELETDPELHQTLARAALRTLGEGEEPVLRVSPDAHSAILTCFGGETLSVDGVRARLKLDPTMEGLGCIAENEHRRVSGTIAERLRTIRRALEDERAQESEGT